MTLYRLFDARLKIACNGPAVRMTTEQAILANRDLFLAGRRNVGWIEAAKIEAGPVKPRAAPTTKPPVVEPSPDLIDALIALGYKQRKAQALAASAPAGNVSDQIQAIFAKGATA